MLAKKVFMVLMIAILCLLPVKESIASPNIEVQTEPPGPPEIETSTGIAPTPDTHHSGISSLPGSNVVFDPSVGGDTCYVPNTPQTFCFKSETFSNAYEYVYNNWIKFPSDWTVSNVYVQGTPVCDSGVPWSAFSWSFQTSPYEVKISHIRPQQSSDHCVATYCVNVTPAGIASEGKVSWYFKGDIYAAPPRYPCSDDGYTPAGQSPCDEMINPVAAVPSCQVILEPDQIMTSGCHGDPKSRTMTLTNQTGAAATFDITYDYDFTVDFSGPFQITLANGETSTFDILLDPHICANDGDYDATMTVSDGTYGDQSTIHYEVYSEKHEWQYILSNPIALMDNVLADYDGKVWSITGYGSLADVSYYNPADATWTTVPASAPPWGGSGHPRSGCQMNNEVFIYGDSTGAYTGLWSYNMDTNTWAQETPSGTPPPYTGIWAPSWVADTKTGRCYMTGGATKIGVGDLATVFVYDVLTNAWLQTLPSFTSVRDFHAAYLYTRPADAHKLLCVVGGAGSMSVVLNSTQCFDFYANTWNAENDDLGQIPLSLWSMGYTQRAGPGGEQFWLVGGDNGLMPTNQTWYYDVSSGVWIDGGLLTSVPVFRTAAVTLDGSIYHVGGWTGVFPPTGSSDKRVDEVCPACVVPGFTKQATEFAYPGQTIHYTISLDPFPLDTAIVFDILPDSVEYVPGSLSVSPDVGFYDYDSGFRGIWWDYPIDSVLWDQPLSATNPVAYINQEFSDSPTYSSFLADDFVATTPWLIDTIFVPGDGWYGFTTLTNASMLTFMIFEDEAGIPAGNPSGGGMAPIWLRTLLPTNPQITITNGSGGFPSDTLLTLNEPLLLPAGHYWLIYYPTLDDDEGGRFGRQSADTLNLNTAQFINPGGGFGGSFLWQPWTVLGPTQQDMAFRIEGNELGTIQIEFDATASEYNQHIRNTTVFYYGSYVLDADDDTFTGHGIFLPMTIK